MDPENSRTLQPQESIYTQKKLPPIVKKNEMLFLKLGPQTLLVVQEKLSRTKMYSVVKLWNIFHWGSWQQEDVFSAKKIDLVVWQLFLWHFKVDIEKDTIKILNILSTMNKYSAWLSHITHMVFAWLIVSSQWVTEVTSSTNFTREYLRTTLLSGAQLSSVWKSLTHILRPCLEAQAFIILRKEYLVCCSGLYRA